MHSKLNKIQFTCYNDTNEVVDELNAVAVALNYEEIKWNPERVSNIEPFINKYK